MSPRRRPLTATVRLSPGPGAPHEARRALRRTMGRTEPDVVDRALLLTSEVVTNAVMHAQTAFTLMIEDDGSRLRVVVEDGDQHPPVVQAHSGPHGGFGLQIVEQLSDAWGVAPRDDGKAVWFEITLPPASRHKKPTVAGSLADASH